MGLLFPAALGLRQCVVTGIDTGLFGLACHNSPFPSPPPLSSSGSNAPPPPAHKPFYTVPMETFKACSDRGSPFHVPEEGGGLEVCCFGRAQIGGGGGGWYSPFEMKGNFGIGSLAVVLLFPNGLWMGDVIAWWALHGCCYCMVARFATSVCQPRHDQMVLLSHALDAARSY